ncbi:hypothetical protein IKW73_00180 [Candidatus Saccharibacteria bacterium]|nr:hypothetical protein [Candidatus Saccharibacteria bacterium]
MNKEPILIYTPEDLEEDRREEIRASIREIFCLIFRGPLDLLAKLFFFLGDVFDDIGWFFY